VQQDFARIPSESANYFFVLCVCFVVKERAPSDAHDLGAVKHARRDRFLLRA